MEENREVIEQRLPYGFCGMPCALCPYYHTKGISKCIGCTHDGFFTGACNIYKCCKKNNIKHCASCPQHPCINCQNLKEFNCLNTGGIWLKTCHAIKINGFEQWYINYSRKAKLLEIALQKYNNGRMKKYLCGIFIDTDLAKLECLMREAESFSGYKKDICIYFRRLINKICHK